MKNITKFAIVCGFVLMQILTTLITIKFTQAI